VIEILAALVAIAVGIIFSTRLHPGANWIGKVAFCCLLFVFCLGPVYLCLKTMGVVGIVVVIGLPLAMGIASINDASEWVVSDGKAEIIPSRWQLAFIGVMILGCIAYVAYQLSAALLMGDLKDSYWIFNFDNAARLSQAWRVHYASTYPPQTLTIPAVGGMHHHFGSVALGSFFAGLVGGDVGTAYLRFTTPMILIPAVLAPVVVIFMRTRSLFLGVIPLMIFALHLSEPSDISKIIGLSPELFNITLGMIEGDPGIIWDVFMGQPVHGSAQAFGNLVLDGANVSIIAFSSIMMAAVFLFRRKTFGLFVVGLTPMALLMNTRFGALVAVLIGANLLIYLCGKKTRNALVIVGVFISIVLAYAVYGSELTILIPNMTPFITLDPRHHALVKIETLVTLALMLLLMCLHYSLSWRENQKYLSAPLTFGSSFMITGFTLVLAFAILQPLLNGHYNLYEHQVRGYLETTILWWAIFLLLCVSVGDSIEKGGRKVVFTLTITEGISKARSVIIGLMLFGGASWVVLHGYHAGVQLVKLLNEPQSGHDAVDFVDYLPCLDEAGAGSVLVANSVRYPAHNYHRARSFVSHLHLRGNLRALSAASSTLTLLRNPDISSKEIVDHLDQVDATHILIDKGQPWPADLAAYVMFSNKTCALIDIEQLPSGQSY
jgi:hypothetical protein